MADEQIEQQVEYETTWGPKLFWATLVAILVFFWWLILYSHGVLPTE